MPMSETEIWLRLMDIPSIYGDVIPALFNTLRECRHIAPEQLQNLGMRRTQIKQFFQLNRQQVIQVSRWLEQEGNGLITLYDADYPPQLRAITDYPAAFFIQGDRSVLHTPQLAVVGSRNFSWYGGYWGREFCSELANCLTITSGLAVGIDSVAHRAALSAGGKTIAVLGSGLNNIYPRRHHNLARQIVAEGGAIISEFPLWTTPWPGNFPRRNRIISGLSLGVLVIEAAQRSGSLVTARYALDQGRDVFALPGPLSNPGSDGPHSLIQQGAILASSPQDILEHLPVTVQALSKMALKQNYSGDPEPPPLPFPELLANVGDEVTPVDVVAERAGQPVPVTVSQLLELELAGWIAAVPGGYVRLRRACHVRRTNVLV